MRIIATLLALLLLVAGSPGSVAASPSGSDQGADRPQRVRISITATPEWVRRGGLVTLKGTVKGTRGRATVTIYQKNKGARKWVVETVKRTSRKGNFTHREDINTGDRTYRACVKRACDSVLVHMGKQPVQDTAVSIAAVSSASVEAGQAFTVSGAASSNLNGRSVEVQAYDNATAAWSAVGRADVQNGAWSAPTAVTTAGRGVALRAAFTGGIGLKPSSSTATAVTVFGWHYLYDLEEVAGGYYASSFGINGTTYSKSVGLYEYDPGDTDSAEIDVSRSCIRFTATVGVQQDAGDTSTTYTGRLLADAATVWTAGDIRYNTAVPVDVNITGALRLRLEGTVTAGGSDYLVFGDARVLCAF